MILYNTLMGLCAGLLLLLTARIVRRIDDDDDDRETIIAGKRDAVRLVLLGVPLTVLAGAMALTWPLKVNPPVNIAFAEPALVLGLLAVAGGVVVLHVGSVNRAYARTFQPIIGALGLMMLALSAAIFRFDLIGDAPAIEPITGQFKGWENTTFGLAYLIVAIGCLGALAVHRRAGQALAYWGWTLGGLFFLMFSILNYYTHVGLLTCANGGPCHPF